MKNLLLASTLLLLGANAWSGCATEAAGAKQNFQNCLQAAQQGDAVAQKDLGNLYTRGQGVAQNHEQAVTWYRKAAGQGNLNAMYNLGVMYDRGDGVARDQKLAADWYRRAADLGDAPSQYNLGVMYEYGEGVTRDYRQALILYGKAAAQGEPAAQFSIGLMYEKGFGVTRDPVMAYMWWDIAGLGHEHAIHNRDSIATEMTPAQIEDARRRAKSWLAAHPQLPPHPPWNSAAN